MTGDINSREWTLSGGLLHFPSHRDVLNRSHVVNLKLITGYVNDDKAVNKNPA